MAALDSGFLRPSVDRYQAISTFKPRKASLCGAIRCLAGGQQRNDRRCPEQTTPHRKSPTILALLCNDGPPIAPLPATGHINSEAPTLNSIPYRGFEDKQCGVYGHERGG